MENISIFRIKTLMANNWLFNIFIIFYICFHDFFEQLITKYLVLPFLSTFQDNWSTIIIFALGFVYLIYRFISTYKNKVYISDRRTYFVTIIMLLWFYYRFFYTIWEYENVASISFLKYIDILFVGCLSIILSKIFYKQSELKLDEKLGLKDDNAIIDESEDKLSRNNIAGDLATKIINTKVNSGSFAIGIVAPWGYGKTSFLNLLEAQLNKQGAIIIKFNPWVYEKEKSLTMAFFSEISSVLSKYNQELVSEMMEYAQLLSSIDNTATKLLSKLIENKQRKDINTIFPFIDKTIKNIGRPIVIYIDDLDRLDKYEISEVLKLIRNSANFTNMIFIGAYDRNYLINALQQINSYQSPIFLEKIFQYEFNLPDFDTNVLNTQIIELVKEFVLDEELEIIKRAMDDTLILDINTGFVDEYIASMRDVKRFVNSFRIAYERLRGEVDIIDLMNVELLRIKYPKIYDLLVSKWERFLYIKNDYFGDQIGLWTESNNINSNQYSKYNGKKVDLKKHINDNIDILGLRLQQVDDIMVLIKTMFPEYDLINKGINKINRVNAIKRYFYYSLLDSDLSVSDFNKLWTLTYEEIKNSINEMITTKSRSLITQITHRTPNGTEEYKKIVRTIFYIGSVSKGWTMDYNKVTQILSLNSYINIDDIHKKFIIDVFNENWDNEYALKYFQSLYFNTITWHFILPKDEIINMNYEYYKMHLETKPSIEISQYYLGYTTYNDWIPAEGGGYNEKKQRNKKADLLFIEYTTSNIKQFIHSLIKRIMDDEPKYYINISATSAWGALDSFVEYIYKINDNSPFFIEFISFMELCKEDNFSNGISFEFKEIPIS